MSRLNPKDKFRTQEEEMDRQLMDAGLFEAGMSTKSKESLLHVIEESRRQSNTEALQSTWSVNEEDEELEEAAYRSRQESDTAVLLTSTMAEKGEEDTKEKEQDEDNEEDGVSTTALASSRNSQHFDTFQILNKSGLFPPSPERVSKSEGEDEEMLDDKARNDESIFNFNTDNDVYIIEPATNIALARKESDDDSSRSSFKSASESNPPMSVTSTDKFPRHESNAAMEFAAVMKADAGWNPMKQTDNEPKPFYEIRLAKLKANKEKPLRPNLFYDGTLSKAEHRSYTLSTLEKNSIMMTKMLMDLKYNSNDPNAYEKWAPPILTCDEKNIESMDRYPSREPDECLRLPWGDKPVILAWKSKTDSVTSRSHSSYQASKPSLSLSKLYTLGTSVTKYPTSSSSHQTGHFSATGDENFKPKQRASASNVVYDSSDEDDNDDDTEWLLPHPKNKKGGQKNQDDKGFKGKQAGKGGGAGRGRGRGRGNKKNSGGRGEDFRPGPPVVGVQPVALSNRRVQPISQAGISATSSHPPLDDNEERNACPICDVSFPISLLENHAANCMSYQDTQSHSTCPHCNTVVPESVVEQHNLKCGIRRTRKLEGPSTSVSSQGAGNTSQDIENMISEDEDVTSPPPAKRRCSINNKES